MKRNRAFTLVELLVVIGIIATLIGILLPALNKARQSANMTACMANLHNIGLGIAMYTSNWKGSFPEGTAPNGSDSWVSLMAFDMHLNGNPSGMGTAKMGTADQYKSLGMFLCPDATVVSPTPATHFSCNPLLMPAMAAVYPAGFPEASLVGKNRKPYKVTQVPHSGDTILIFDGTQGQGTAANGGANPVGAYIDCDRISGDNLTPTNPGITYLIAGYNNVSLGDSVDGGLNKDAPPASNSQNIRWRHMHNTMANFLFVDGHVASLRYNSEFNTELLRRNVYVPTP